VTYRPKGEDENFNVSRPKVLINKKVETTSSYGKKDVENTNAKREILKAESANGKRIFNREFLPSHARGPSWGIKKGPQPQG